VTNDFQRVLALALASAVLFAGLEATRLFAPPARAPRINVRWADGITDRTRQDAERRLGLLAAERRDGTTWAYDLGDPTEHSVRGLLTDPSVADTHYVDRERAAIALEAPRGTTVITRNPFALLRDSTVFTSLQICFASIALISTVWLVTTGRRAMVPRE